MIICDTIINLDLDTSSEDSRIRNGKVYAYCHEKNIVAQKQGKNEHYFVFSNPISNKCVLMRTIRSNESKGNKSLNAVTYNINNYKDFIVFSSIKYEKSKIDCLSMKYKRLHFDKSRESLIKKVIATSNAGQRPICFLKNLFYGVDIEKYENEVLNGIGGRKTYGCGLIIPDKVYCHLMNFVERPIKKFTN